MKFRSRLRNFARPFLANHRTLKSRAHALDDAALRWRHSLAHFIPTLIKPDARHLSIAVTANCNLRCVGCCYGRDYMPQQRLDLRTVTNILDDARALDFTSVQLYGGEPLTHPDLVRMVEHSTRLGLSTVLTTNGVLLERKVDELHAAGLRSIGFGLYGVGKAYDRYVQKPGSFERVEAGMAAVRDRWGDGVMMAVGWLLMRPTCNVEAVRDVWALTGRYRMPLEVGLIHYSFPYFSEGPDRELQFFDEDRAAVEEVVSDLISRKRAHPSRISNSEIGLRSIPDWLTKKADMQVPCTRYRNVWVGADGSVHMCVGTPELGNVNEQRLIDVLYSRRHERAAADCFALNCPNCHVGFDRRVQAHAASRARYSTA